MIKICKNCSTRLSIYNFDKRGLCYSCLKIADKDVIKSPVVERSGRLREYELRKRADRDEY